MQRLSLRLTALKLVPGLGQAENLVATENPVRVASAQGVRQKVVSAQKVVGRKVDDLKVDVRRAVAMRLAATCHHHHLPDPIDWLKCSTQTKMESSVRKNLPALLLLSRSSIRTVTVH